MDANKIHPTSSIERAHKVDPTSSVNVGHGKLPTCNEFPIIDDQHPLKEIPPVKRERTLQLLRRYITTLGISKYSVAANLPIGSEPSVTDGSSNGTKRSRVSTFSSVGSAISGAETSVFSLVDGSEHGFKSYRPLPEDLRARKALMRYIGTCAACSRTKTKCLLTHHDFQSLLDDPRTDNQARADIKWVHHLFATDTENVQSVQDFATPLDDPLVQLRLVGDQTNRDELMEKVDEAFKVLPMVKEWARNADGVYLYPRTLDIADGSVDLLSNRAGVPRDSTKNMPCLSLVIIQSSPGASIEFLPPEGTADFISAVHIYDQSDDSLQIKVARIIENFEMWRGFFCPFGHAERTLDMMHVTPIKDGSIMDVSCSACNEVEDNIDKANQHNGPATSVTDKAPVVADSPCYSETSSIKSSTDLSRDLKGKPSSAEILRGYISFAQHTGFTDAAPSSSSSSKSRGASHSNNKGTHQTSQTTISSKKRGRDVDDDSSDWNGDTKKSKISGSSDHEAEEGCSFICPFFAFSLIMRYGCSCSNRNFKSMNSLRAHILVDHREFQCGICHEIFPKEIALAKHKDTDCTKLFLCKQCLQGFPKVELENHWCRKTSIPRCSQCLERFPSQDQRLKHEIPGCTYTPLPEFRIVDDILYEEIKKSLEKKHWTFANEQDNNKKTWINNNVGKFSGELSHKQRELIKWIALWECFPFAKSIPDSPFRDMTIPTSDVQFNEITRKVKDVLRIKLFGDDHPLSSDSEKQEEQVAWFLDSLDSTLRQFANMPKRPVPRRVKTTSQGIRPASKTPFTSTPAMFEVVNHVMSNTSADVLEPTRRAKQGSAAADSQRELMPPPPSAPSQVTSSSLSTPQPLSNHSQISNRSLPLNHGDVYNPRQNPAQPSFADPEQLLAQQHSPNHQQNRSGVMPEEFNTTPLTSMPYWGYSSHMDTQMPNGMQPAVGLQQQIHGEQKNYTQHRGHVRPLMGGVDLSGAGSFAYSPPIPNLFNETPDKSPATDPTPQPDGTIAPNLLLGFGPLSFMGAQYWPDADPNEPNL